MSVTADLRVAGVLVGDVQDLGSGGHGVDCFSRGLRPVAVIYYVHLLSPRFAGLTSQWLITRR